MDYNFEWDSVKALKNLKKHGISFKKASDVFLDPLHLSIIDGQHDETEERWITLGQSKASQLLLVIHTFVKHDDDYIITIRLISARAATKFEQRQYKEIG